MINLIAYISAWIVGSTLSLWALYALVYAFVRWADNRTGFWPAVAAFTYNVFWTIDVIYNLTTGSLIFLESPGHLEETFSQRLRRNYFGPKGWRRVLAAEFRTHVNRVEEGHI